jgi:TRAP-type C4-dicarboxylate transport system permease small subunit
MREVSMLRRSLDNLYLWSGYLAAVFLMMIAVLVIAQVMARYFGILFESTETGGFCLAASTFLGLAHTLKRGEHIRVTLLIRHLQGRARSAIELWCTGCAIVVMLYLVWHTGHMMYESWHYDELSPGMMAVPIWIPQSGMLLGSLVLTVAFIDEFCLICAGATPGYEERRETALGDLDMPMDESHGEGPGESLADTHTLNPGRAS